MKRPGRSEPWPGIVFPILGGVPEWSIGAVLKTAVGASSPWVRIPPPPLVLFPRAGESDAAEVGSRSRKNRFFRKKPGRVGLTTRYMRIMLRRIQCTRLGPEPSPSRYHPLSCPLVRQRIENADRRSTRLIPQRRERSVRTEAASRPFLAARRSGLRLPSRGVRRWPLDSRISIGQDALSPRVVLGHFSFDVLMVRRYSRCFSSVRPVRGRSEPARGVVVIGLHRDIVEHDLIGNSVLRESPTP